MSKKKRKIRTNVILTTLYEKTTYAPAKRPWFLHLQATIFKENIQNELNYATTYSRNQLTLLLLLLVLLAATATTSSVNVIALPSATGRFLSTQGSFLLSFMYSKCFWCKLRPVQFNFRSYGIADRFFGQTPKY